MTTATFQTPTAEQPTTVHPPAAGRPRRGLVQRLAHDTLYLLAALPMGVLSFSVAVGGWSTALGSLLTFIGVPVAVLTIAATRGLANVERARAGLARGEPVRGVYRTPLPLSREAWSDLATIWSWFKGLFLDRQTWKDLLYALLLLPIGTVGFTVIVTALTMTLGFITFPAWWWALPDGWDTGAWNIDSWADAGILAAIGLVLVPLGIALVRGTSAASAGIAAALLGPGTRELEERVERLQETRAGAVDAARLELERIERDLHDGAQARLVAVAMELGRAEQKLRAGDEQGAGALVTQARDETQRALAELRDLARGIRPALLSERGLREAIVSLAGRAPVPATVEYDAGGRLPIAVETAAYFVVGEALANVGKHAQASSASVRIERRGPRLEIEVRDDGDGGANPEGGGLTGLRRRVEALDGTLFLSSPPGGPTILRAELPCAS